jgi:hypothetical protein
MRRRNQIPPEPATAARLRERARSLLSPDPHAGGPNADEYTTTSIYFDTPDFAVYKPPWLVPARQVPDSPVRIRRDRFSGTQTPDEPLCQQRRTTVGVEDLPLLTSSSVDRSWSGAWFHDRLLARRLAPVAEVSYQRTARVGMTDYGPMRLTVDEHVVGMAIDTPCFLQLDSALPLTSSAILELKFRGPMPAVFKRIVEEFALVAQACVEVSTGDAGHPGSAAQREARRDVAQDIESNRRHAGGAAARVSRWPLTEGRTQ